MNAHSEILRLAKNEVDNPRFAVTKQILGVHAVIREGGQPCVVGLDEAYDPAAVFVFFALEGEPYHLWVRVGVASSAVEFAGVEPSTSVSLVVESESLEPDEITELLGLVPTETVTKGTVRASGVGVRQTHSWVFEPSRGDVLFFETKLRKLLQIASGRRDCFDAIAGQSSVEVSVVSWQCAAWPQGFSFEASTMAAFVSWGASLDIDMYSSGPPELGDDDT